MKSGEQILVVDAESDGLYGQIFAIGALVMTGSKLVDKFAGFYRPTKFADEWVEKNILPEVSSLPEYPDSRTLRDAFWAFYRKYKDCDIVGDVIYPVESRLFRDCVEDNLAERIWQGPYPFIDVVSFIPREFRAKKRLEFAIDLYYGKLLFLKELDITVIKEHNPVHDALISGLIYLYYL